MHRAVRHRRSLLALALAGLLVGAFAAWGRPIPGTSAAPAAAAVAAAAEVRLKPDPTPDQSPSFTVVARKYEFSPARIQVRQNDLVKITFVAEDIPHSFTLDALRIAKRASPGHPVVFNFRAELPEGQEDVTYPFYCNLSIDDGCRRMRGELTIERAR